MRADVKSIGDFKFPLLGLVCSCLSLSLGPASLPSLEPSFCCVHRLCQSVSQCGTLLVSVPGFFLLMWSISLGQLWSRQHFDRHGNGKVIGHSTDWDGLRQDASRSTGEAGCSKSDSLLANRAVLCYFLRAFSGSAAQFPGTVLHGSSEAGNSPACSAKLLVL